MISLTSHGAFDSINLSLKSSSVCMLHYSSKFDQVYVRHTTTVKSPVLSRARVSTGLEIIYAGRDGITHRQYMLDPMHMQPYFIVA